ncbi:type II toxin-antitoxin system VapC family toxin [Occultella kanbiaonis]|uniref:type II toxin-antitoxin system VapC family toxin n=1 Tax=Occultella kanbiaonis TaxID=2675754 RepID=UPI0013D55944|nr:type II toxin-antitoxin system VapC family toxin [Occultella kanbiaonis]
MIVDTSALIAILVGEPAARTFARALAESEVKISAATLVEARAVVTSKLGPTHLRQLDALLRETQVLVVPFDEQQAAVAGDAYRDFGRGSGHPARLNLGDCFSYALAATTGEPLLFKGRDFNHTDLRSAVT